MRCPRAQEGRLHTTCVLHASGELICALDLPDLVRLVELNLVFSLWTGAQEVARFKVDHFQILALSAGQVMLFKAKQELGKLRPLWL